MISARSGWTELTDILLIGESIDTDIQENVRLFRQYKSQHAYCKFCCIKEHLHMHVYASMIVKDTELRDLES